MTHDAIVDRSTFDRVQALLGSQVDRSHELVYAGDLIQCGHCGQAITGEANIKKTKQGQARYRYDRRARDSRPGHPRVRLKESELDLQVLALIDQIRVEGNQCRQKRHSKSDATMTGKSNPHGRPFISSALVSNPATPGTAARTTASSAPGKRRRNARIVMLAPMT